MLVGEKGTRKGTSQNFFEWCLCMAQYDSLPIYKKAFDLCLYFEKIVKNFSRYNKYTLGSDLRNKSREICVCIAKANSLVDKREVLKELVVLVEELKMIVRLCKEAKVFHNFNSYIYSTGLIVDLAKQANGWSNSVQN
jgi:hypothetical protein